MNTQSAALTAAQNLVNLIQQFEQLSNSVDAYMKAYNQAVYDSQWQAMATVNVNADGSPAGTNDGTPNNAHPINLPTVSPLLVSRNNLINGVAMLQQFQTFMTQAGGTITMPAQSNVKSSYMITG